MSDYVGRFAPTPSGLLHFGSLTSAVASWLDARAHGGQWYVRIEDIDPPRCPPDNAPHILEQLHAFGLEWDRPPSWQHQHGARYQKALDLLVEKGLAYPCTCSRKEWREHTVYPGWCRNGPRHPERAKAWRFNTSRVPGTIEWCDRRLGHQHWQLSSLGDVVLKRRDGLWAYQLAVVVDDAFEGVTDVVRGADLLDNTPWQFALYRALEKTPPRTLHLPLMVASNGQKLSKQNLAPALMTDDIAVRQLLHRALISLNQAPVPSLQNAPVRHQLDAALERWSPDRLPGQDIILES
ncbi:tRNA glutamyl-Q(34) synthetase GluQRS [Larsenimonas suaedae]|uniref:Glutamyl-Q tRNA(Asp) synthetase n=1 Tax=Larsenimonas suaedae TaxID=1851019 RepID=A0ABU1H049_9GAMM|nr:tRNA glutamyl-Q(34) synthetase GluQRS [Larsenimonas suaedae]MCM2973603.1 tRNA glutamyl-Q(34) synthetase GluQRS [Larsenimonas suaedae]MDR5897027.1 tRNA glutamyl-Q(34) synthetase GluQRS [Larsenimonas suaedae]